MKSRAKDRLILGSAGKKYPDALTLDSDPEHAPDVLHDLNQTPLPFADNQFSEIHCHHVLEHLDDLMKLFDEFHRICRADGTIFIEVPHHTSWCANTPFHKLKFNGFAFDIWVDTQPTWKTGKKFQLLKREVTFHRAIRRWGLPKLFNRYLMAYERFWAYIFPAEHLKVWLRPVK